MRKIELDGVKNPFVKRLIIENSNIFFENARARVRMDCKAPQPLDELDVQGVCKPTDLTYAIRFSPVRTQKGASFKIKMSKPFLLKCNMLYPKGQIRVKGYEDIVSRGDEVTKWLVENTTLDEETFNTARDNPYLWVPFCLRYGDYAKKTGTYVMTDYRINNPFNGGND